MAIIDMFDRGWRANPDGVAYIADDRSYGFDEIGRLSCRIANALLALGPAEGDQGRGARGQRPDLVDLRPRALARRAWPGCRSIPATASRPTSACSTASTARCCSSRPRSSRSSSSSRRSCRRSSTGSASSRRSPGCPSLDEWIDGHADAPPVVDYRPDDVVAVMPTGGTTGKSKGVMNTHRSFQTFCGELHDHLQLPGRRADREPRGGADDAHGRRAVAAVHRARRHRRRADQARARRRCST